MRLYVGNVSLRYRRSIKFLDVEGKPFSSLRETDHRLVRIVVNFNLKHITSLKTVPQHIVPPVFIYLCLKWAINYIKKFVAIQTYYILQA